MKRIVLLCAVLGVFFSAIYAEETILESFRYRANLLIQSDWTASDIDVEVEFGKKLAARILGQYKLLDNPALQNYVNLLGQGIASTVGRPELTYYFSIIDSDHVNAYAAPGGYIFVTKGLLDKCVNEAQLVGVLAHELSHVNRRYIINKYNIRGNNNTLLTSVGQIVGGATQSTRIALNMIIEKVMDELLSEGLDKEEELKADVDALLYMSSLNYDWSAYVGLISSLHADNHSQSVSHTHPTVLERSNLMGLYAKENNIKGEVLREQRYEKYKQL